jgi:hypothetical protein
MTYFVARGSCGTRGGDMRCAIGAVSITSLFIQIRLIFDDSRWDTFGFDKDVSRA